MAADARGRAGVTGAPVSRAAPGAGELHAGDMRAHQTLGPPAVAAGDGLEDALVVVVAQGMCLFAPTFSFLARVLRQRARRAITLLGLLGGLATLLAYPGAALLSEAFGRRIAVAGFAALTALGMAPLKYAGGALLEPASCRLRGP